MKNQRINRKNPIRTYQTTVYGTSVIVRVFQPAVPKQGINNEARHKCS